jgi:hypothetical protein
VLTLDSVGDIVLWNIVDQEIVQRFPKGTTLKEATQAIEVDTYCPSWCSVECRWGALGVTIAAETAFEAEVNTWWLKYCNPAKRKAGGSNDLSIFTIPRQERRGMLEGPLVNLGELAVQQLLKKHDARYAVWSLQGSPSQPFCLVQRFAVEDGPQALPTWVHDVVKGKLPSSSVGSSSTVTVELLSFNKKELPPLKTSVIKVRKRMTVAELAAEIVSALHLKLPKTKDLVDGLLRMTDGTLKLAGETRNEDAGGSLQPEEFLEIWSLNSEGQKDQQLEPMMMMVTAFYVYKERGSGVLRLWYCRNRYLPT